MKTTYLLYILVVFYGLAGLNHFLKPNFYVAIMPNFLPQKTMLNYATGVIQLMLAAGLFLSSTRNMAVYLTIAMLLSYLFLIHIPHLINPPKIAKDKKLFLIMRIPLQFLLIYLTWKLIQ